jgi:2-isopropylmalate synthase
MKHQLGKTKEEVLEMTFSGVSLAKKYVADVEFTPMDASRSDHKFVFQMAEAAIQAGATTINIADTVGHSDPDEFVDLIAKVLDEKNVKNIGEVTLSVHCHDDLGMAVANSLMAIKKGARQVEGCINGIGERAGNAALEEIIMAIHVKGSSWNLATNINTKEIYSASNMVRKLTGICVQPNKAIVGRNAFRHESGIHQDGQIKNRNTFEIINPEDIGRNPSEIVIGRTSGRAGVRAKLTELGFSIDKNSKEFDIIFEAVKNKANDGGVNDRFVKQFAEQILIGSRL